MISCNLIGAGRLGKQVAKSFIHASLISVQAICNQSLTSSKEAAKLLGQGIAISSIDDLPVCDVLFLAVPDDQLTLVCQQLKDWKSLHRVKIIIHFSGALSSELLNPLKTHQQAVASLHPLKSFNSLALEQNALEHVDCVIEGDEPALQWIEKGLAQLNAKQHSISSKQKALYHAAASISANYLTTLADISHQFFLEAGVREEQASQMIAGLMQSCISNIVQKKRPIEALTGPLIRKDHETLRLHCKAIKDPLLLKTYQQLAITTAVRADFSEQSMQALKSLLQSPTS